MEIIIILNIIIIIAMLILFFKAMNIFKKAVEETDEEKVEVLHKSAKKYMKISICLAPLSFIITSFLLFGR
ncbi:MAG: hypothetical protein ACRDCB_08245 [Clostridium sp.]|uniref:hypothetical protein n=1 Tax=Clostridium TaxID=1485 RepID=UPI00215389E7|nr:hypothetical protein [Clostridium sp. LY3-2]MCR6515481.1 hypothetical protein [Clostridium sp. LY3-2]